MHNPGPANFAVLRGCLHAAQFKKVLVASSHRVQAVVRHRVCTGAFFTAGNIGLSTFQLGGCQRQLDKQLVLRVHRSVDYCRHLDPSAVLPLLERNQGLSAP